MKLLILSVGTRLPGWANEAFAEYAKRMPRQLAMELHEIRAEPRTSGKTAAQMMQVEGERILRALPPRARLVAMDEHGKQQDTKSLAAWVALAQQDGRDAAFAIGGPDGLSDEVRTRAEGSISLSRLTLPHALARVMLAEALYRAHTVNEGHPYHRE